MANETLFRGQALASFFIMPSLYRKVKEARILACRIESSTDYIEIVPCSSYKAEERRYIFNTKLS